MCGIVGHVVLHRAGPDVAAVTAACQRLRHRGPDGEGVARFDQACLGHRRLSVIDVAGSPQPWRSIDGRYTMVFNGEIYNYVELRSELRRKGHVFRSNGDTEVLLAMWIEDRSACLSRLNGMFSFAIWDDKLKQLVLVRDRLGQKPLYYAQDGDNLAFASDIAALCAFSFINLALEPESVHDFFSHQFIGGERTIYRGIRKCLPGHYLVHGNGATSLNRYWRPPLPIACTQSASSMGEELEGLIEDAVRIRLRSDVALGAFLSGGLDSAIVVAAMAKAGADVESFTVGFPQESFDESAEAERLAQHFDTRHHPLQLTMDVGAVFDRALGAFGEPFADPSAIPTWYLCEHARRSVVVALSGDGVDELFGGYRRYYARQWITRVRHLPKWLWKHLLPGVARHLPENGAYYAQDSVKKLKLFSHMLRCLDETPGDSVPQVFSLKERQQLIDVGFMHPHGHDFLTEFGLHGVDPLSQMMLTDLQTYLAEDILTKIDRMSMCHSLEVRSPFLDHRIVDFACRMDASWKLNHGIQKYLLRQCYQGKLPERTLRRKKHGFAVPLKDWFSSALKTRFESLVLDATPPEFFNKREIHRLWFEHRSGKIDHGFKLWTLLVFCQWYHNRATMSDFTR